PRPDRYRSADRGQSGLSIYLWPQSAPGFSLCPQTKVTGRIAHALSRTPRVEPAWTWLPALPDRWRGESAFGRGLVIKRAPVGEDGPVGAGGRRARDLFRFAGAMLAGIAGQSSLLDRP